MNDGYSEDDMDVKALPDARITAFRLTWRRGFSVILGMLIIDAIAFEFIAVLEEVATWAQILVDGMVMVVLLAPLFYFLVLRPFQENIDDFSRMESKLRRARRDLQDKVEEKTRQLRILNQELEQRIQQQDAEAHDQRLLSEMSDMLQSCSTTREAFDIFGEFARRLCPGSAGALSILADSQNYLEVVSEWGDGIHTARVFAPDECWAVRRGISYLSEHNYPATTCEHVEAHEGHRYLCIPLSGQGESLGTLNIAMDAGETPAQLRMDHIYRQMAEFVALAIANLRLREKLHHQSIQDGLTKLFNRRYMENLLDREIQRAIRKEYMVAVVMIDVDHFKKFNDTYGHAAGDAVLREVAQRLQSGIRASDVACRYGGEEFTLVMPEVTIEYAEQRCNEIRKAIQALVIEDNGQTLSNITVSMGIAVYPNHGDTPDTLVRVADEALYEAKESGRNQVVVAKESTVEMLDAVSEPTQPAQP